MQALGTGRRWQSVAGVRAHRPLGGGHSRDSRTVASDGRLRFGHSGSGRMPRLSRTRRRGVCDPLADRQQGGRSGQNRVRGQCGYDGPSVPHAADLGDRAPRPVAPAGPGSPQRGPASSPAPTAADQRQVERFNRTLLDEWAYLRPYTSNTECTEALEDFLHTYNHHCCHTALGGQPPISRVINAAAQYSQNLRRKAVARVSSSLSVGLCRLVMRRAAAADPFIARQDRERGTPDCLHVRKCLCASPPHCLACSSHGS